MRKTALIILVIFALLLTSTACGSANNAGVEAESTTTVAETESTTVAESKTVTRTILLWASGARMDTPFDGPVARRLNKMMEAEIPDSMTRKVSVNNSAI